ncbi:hypothetical protein Glove_326g66 [Diversispora epigaea]|uniref:Uncharacterized protein n=1 Tax=Diversispora epigaea TaxID=1348612 RepID=A0A397HSE3_9GLOM|nr:hypothetical protein Glove_326g66 [Diversispora epigaea]
MKNSRKVLEISEKKVTRRNLSKVRNVHFNNLLKKEPNNALALKLRGETYLKLEKYNEALTDFDKLLEIEPNNTLNLDLYEEIINKYNEILEIEPNNTLALRSRGETYKMLNKYKESLDDFNKILKITSYDVSVINLIIEIEKEQQTGSRMVQSIKTESSEFINWIPYSQFKDLKYIAEGGFGVDLLLKLFYKIGIQERYLFGLKAEIIK